MPVRLENICLPLQLRVRAHQLFQGRRWNRGHIGEGQVALAHAPPLAALCRALAPLAPIRPGAVTPLPTLARAGPLLLGVERLTGFAAVLGKDGHVPEAPPLSL